MDSNSRQHTLTWHALSRVDVMRAAIQFERKRMIGISKRIWRRQVAVECMKFVFREDVFCCSYWDVDVYQIVHSCSGYYQIEFFLSLSFIMKHYMM